MIRNGRLIAIVSTVVLCAIPGGASLDAAVGQSADTDAPTLVQQVRTATRGFQNVANAEAAGYTSLGSCVSSAQEGAMGIHYAKPELIGDGQVDAGQPELLIYEQRGGRLHLVGVEFLVLAADWDAAHGDGAAPVLVGQHFHYASSPNRYRLPAFYELHVWAWKSNRSGTFTDWNPAVACDEYTGVAGASNAGHGDGFGLTARVNSPRHR